MPFARNVFVNCPFDDEYRTLLVPLLFTIYFLRFEPRIALESLNSGRSRIDKIVDLIKASKYAIHDISRVQAMEAGEYFRLNMPLELGIDFACQRFMPGQCRQKKLLILEAEKYRYKAAISDLSGSDIAVHGNRPENLVAQVRNWLNNNTRMKAASPSRVWAAYNEFNADNDAELTAEGFTRQEIEELPIDELMQCMKNWVTEKA